MELGIQSFCLRGIDDNADVAEAVKRCGLRRIEVCAKHTTFDDPSTVKSMADVYSQHGVSVVSIGVNKLTADRGQAGTLFECAKAAGLSCMSVDFPLDESIEESVKLADELSESYGITVGIHNHGGRHWLGSRTALRWVFGKTSTRVGLSLDTAWAIDAREDPLEMVREFGDRLHLLHIKDFTYKPDRTPEDVVVGTGILSLEALDQALSEKGFQGEAILEYEGDVNDPIPALRKCVDAVGTKMKLVTVPQE
jgi:sugar phosphate isomerase/epimerase